jgi:hypothetical protein
VKVSKIGYRVFVEKYNHQDRIITQLPLISALLLEQFPSQWNIFLDMEYRLPVVNKSAAGIIGA